jgi:hypothetical protein
MKSLTKRVAAATAVVAAMAAAGPVTASHAALPSGLGLGTPDPNLCFHNAYNIGPFGPAGPYGPSGPYGADGPLHGYANPIGNAAECGGFTTYLLRGGTVSSYVDASIHPTPATPTTP